MLKKLESIASNVKKELKSLKNAIVFNPAYSDLIGVGANNVYMSDIDHDDYFFGENNPNNPKNQNSFGGSDKEPGFADSLVNYNTIDFVHDFAKNIGLGALSYFLFGKSIPAGTVAFASTTVLDVMFATKWDDSLLLRCGYHAVKDLAVGTLSLGMLRQQDSSFLSGGSTILNHIIIPSAKLGGISFLGRMGAKFLDYKLDT